MIATITAPIHRNKHKQTNKQTNKQTHTHTHTHMYKPNEFEGALHQKLPGWVASQVGVKVWPPHPRPERLDHEELLQRW